MATTPETATEYEQGQLVIPRWVIKRNPGAWSTLITYATDSYVAYGGKIWKALQSSTNQAPAAGSYWTEDAGLYDPPSLTLSVLAPGGTATVHTLVSASTILVKLATGIYEASINTAPASGLWRAELYAASYVGAPFYFKVRKAAVSLPS